MNKSAFWFEHLKAIKQEAISISAYAKRHRLPVKSLYYWQRKLKAATKSPTAPNQPSAFVALRIAEPAKPQQSISCTLLLPAGIRLDISALPTPEWLAALGRAMQGAD
jgi:hypothetical protein